MLAFAGLPTISVTPMRPIAPGTSSQKAGRAFESHSRLKGSESGHGEPYDQPHTQPCSRVSAPRLGRSGAAPGKSSPLSGWKRLMRVDDTHLIRRGRGALLVEASHLDPIDVGVPSTIS